MQYRRFGRTERWLSVFSLGTMRLVECSPAQAEATILEAIAQGCNHLETAPAYGDSEARLGQTLATLTPTQRATLTVTTKVLPTLTAEAVDHSLQQSQARLGQVEMVAVHGINQPEHLSHTLTTVLPVLRAAQAAGDIQAIGFSTHGPLDLILRAIATDQFDFVNLHYHYFQPHNAPALAAAAARDLGVFIISPADKGGQLYQPPQKLIDLCAPLTPLTFAYRFLLSQPTIHTLSLGAAHPHELTAAFAALAPEATQLEPNSSPAPMTDQGDRNQGPLGNLQTIHHRLAQAAIATLGASQCHQCQACLPCPEAIPIPEVLRLRNLSQAYDMVGFGQYRYNMLGQAGHWFPGENASHCTDCGDCLPRCPHQLPIPTLLRETHQHLYQAPLRRLWE